MFGVKQTQVGRFFEMLTHNLVGGELSRNEDGVINVWPAATTVEVKSAGRQSSYGYRLDIEQIHEYVGMCGGFPFKRGWYMFWAYDNPSVRGPEGRSTALSKYEKEAEVRGYLSRTISWCILLDLSIVARWRAVRPVSTRSVLGHEGISRTVDVKCREVAHLANGGFHTELSKLDFDPRGFDALTSDVKVNMRPDLFQHYAVHFPLIAILPTAESAQAQRFFKKRGVRLDRRGR